MSGANEQVGGSHYSRVPGEAHWDRQWRLYGPAWFIGNVTKYVERYQDKNGLQDIDKALQYLHKLRELEAAYAAGTGVPPGNGRAPLAAEKVPEVKAEPGSWNHPATPPGDRSGT